MKKTLLLGLVLCASMMISAKEVPAGYVDLGLPSGTLWKAQNEPGFYMYITAKNKFQKNLPNSSQFDELRNNCSWKYTGQGFRVTGPNGNTLFFPFTGYRDCDEDLEREGITTRFWLVGGGDSYSYYYYLSKDNKGSSTDSNCLGHCVRLVISGK